LVIFDKKYKILDIVNKFEVLKKNRKSLWLLEMQIPPNCVTDVKWQKYENALFQALLKPLI